jgi:beta-alanine degradation protein BauB
MPPENIMNKVIIRGAVLAVAVFAVSQTLRPRQTKQPQRVQQFENDEVKVWKSVVMPNNPLTMHRHEHPRVIVALVRRDDEDCGAARADGNP